MTRDETVPVGTSIVTIVEIGGSSQNRGTPICGSAGIIVGHSAPNYVVRLDGEARTITIQRKNFMTVPSRWY